jgi:hypothetical protein
MLLTIGVVSVFLLLGIKFVLDSYYLDMTETYEHTLIPPTTLRDETRKQQEDAIDHGQIPVSAAMQMLVSKGREADPEVTPQPSESEDLDPLKGWAKLKRDVVLPPLTAPTAPAPTAEAGDAGAAPTNAPTHAPTNAVTDAGAPRRPIAPPHAAPKDGGK